MEIANLITHVEALIFASEKPLTAIEITELVNSAFGFMDDKVVIDQVETSIEGVKEKYNSAFFPFELRESGGGWQFLTKREYHQTIAQLNGDKFLKRLSTAALETLAIIAYKQPITKSEIEAIRGVNCDYSIQKLLEKELIIISGRNEAMVGKPLIYATSRHFMDYFGIKSVKDLPQLKDIHVESNEIGQPADYIDSASADMEPMSEETQVLENEVVVAEFTAASPEPIDNESEVREILAPEVTLETEVTMIEESDMELPNRKQIFMENQQDVSDESAVEKDLRDDEIQ